MLKKFFFETSVLTVYLFVQLPFLVIFVLLGYWVEPGNTSEAFIAYLIALIFVGAAIWVWVRFSTNSSLNFVKIYFTATLVRFLLVILLLSVSLSSIQFEQMFFTVNFIISYLYQSVIELLLIHHRLLKHPVEE
mgnify:FL=1|tara:strand:+ start:30 stop:431 length:402 start_codon:yes stop_codon:yes gene_type:complete